MIIVDVFVPGAAKTKGSMVIRNRRTGAMKESVAGSSTWRALMAGAVRDDIARRYRTTDTQPMWMATGEPYAGAVRVTVAAYLRPPVGFFDRPLYVLAPIWERAGDLDKIVRNVLDALGSRSKNPKYNGGAIQDDNLVCWLTAKKLVASDDFPAGVQIRVETL